MKYTMDNFLLDVNTGIEIRPWQAVSIEITGKRRETAKNRKSCIQAFHLLMVEAVTESISFP